jgi:YegS/Rv2252/BmrU family lipid kinase
MRVLAIINPISGTRGSPEAVRYRVQLAKNLLSSAGASYDVRLTERRGHAYELARAAVARQTTLVFAWGGDGTMNEVGRALAFSPTALALIPAGSGNGLARELRIPFNPEQAFKAALRGRDRTIDAGEIGGQLFFNAAGVGFDAHVTTLFNNRPTGRRGLLSYVTIAARELFSYEPDAYTVVTDSETTHHRALLIAVANSRQYGNGAIVAPQANLSDGRLDLVAVRGRSALRTLWDARRLFNGTTAKSTGVETHPIIQATIIGRRPLCLHIDGEPVANTATTLSVRIHPDALRVRVNETGPT